ncbi:MAG: hypothetical protein ABUL60_31610 [Myxococcales bacterium]
MTIRIWSHARRLLALGALTAWCTQCDLPHGDESFPRTGVDGLERKYVLRLLAPPDVRRIGAVIPVTVEAIFPPETKIGLHYCVRLAGAPGKLVFPFGDRCEAAAAGSEGAGEASGAGASGAPASDSASELNVTQSCIAATATTRDGDRTQVTGTLHAAYFADATETTASLFGVLYANAECRGEPSTSTALLLDLHDPSRSGMGEGGASGGNASGGTSNMAGAAAGHAGSAGTSSGGSGGVEAGGSGGTDVGGSAGTSPGGVGTAGEEPRAGAPGAGGT